MERRLLGNTGLTVSAIGFGCGAVGGLMVRGGEAEQERSIARAIDLGITYFDTAPSYGDGLSETNLGRVLRRLRPDIVLGTKFHVSSGNMALVQSEIATSLDSSLRRLGRDHVDLLQLHNPVAVSGPGTISADVVLQEVMSALARLHAQGKFRFAGFTAVGDTALLHRVIIGSGLATAQVPFNLLNPTAGRDVPSTYPAQHYSKSLVLARDKGLGTIAIRVLAGGALSGVSTRHPIGAATVDPIGSAHRYLADVERASAFSEVAQNAGDGGIPELAIRYALSIPSIATVMVGLSSLEQLEAAAAAALQGALSEKVLRRIAAVQDGFSGQSR